MKPNLSNLHQVFERMEEIRGRFPSSRRPSQELSSRSFARELSSLSRPSSPSLPPSQSGRNGMPSGIAGASVLLDALEKKPRSSKLERSGNLSSKKGKDAWDAEIASIAQEKGVPPELLKAMMQVESGGNPRATSPKGAMGLMQLMPGTAKLMGVKDPYDPMQNLRGGAAYIHQMMKRYGGRTDLALAAYNAGPGRVDACEGIPPFPETQNYVRNVLALYSGFLKEGDALCP